MKNRFLEFGSRINTLHMMVKELTLRFFIFSECLGMLLRTIVPREKGTSKGLRRQKGWGVPGPARLSLAA